jgi:hypothetical protein
MNRRGRARVARGSCVAAVVLAALSCAGAAGPPRPDGLVRGERGSFADGRGAFLPLGASLFWAPWGYKFDRGRVEKHLAFLAGHGVDYIRVLGQAGTPGPAPDDSWNDRPIDPRWSDRCAKPPAPNCGSYDEVIAGLTDLAFDEYGLRVAWTIFGGTGFTPSPASRLALVDRMLAMSKGREHKIIHFEVANEFYHNGFEGPDGLAEVRTLGRHLQDRTPVLVALSAPRASDCGVMQQLHEGGVGEIVSEHFSRSGRDDGWAAIRAPWALQSCKGLPPLRTSNEPIGPFSSVRAEGDPMRLALSAAMTYVSGVGAYVLHTGPGIRGGGRADLERGRPADIWAIPRIDEIFGGLATVRRVLPADVAAWSRHEIVPTDPVGLTLESGSPVQAYVAAHGDRFVILPLAVSGATTIEARRSVHLRVFHPITGAPLHDGELPAGDRVKVPSLPGYVVLGRAGRQE